jgi:hypothetical protein
VAEYTDLVIRQALGQKRAAHLAGAASPDLIPHAVVGDPDATFGTPDAYACDLGGDLGASNTCYVRAAALADGGSEIDAKLYVGVAPPTAMLWPDRLAWLSTTDGDGYAVVSVPPGHVGVSAAPFDTSAVDPGGTVGGYVWTVKDKVVIKHLPSVPALRDFLLATPSFSQRGTLTLPDCRDGHVYACTYEHRADAGAPCRMMFRLEWDAMPDGWTVALEGDHGIELPPTPARGTMGIAKELTLTDSFTASLRWHLQGTAISDRMALRLMVYLVESVNGGDVWYPVGARAFRPPPKSPASAVQRR